MSTHLAVANFVGSIVDPLHWPHRPPPYECVMLPLVSRINGSSQNAREIFERFEFGNEIDADPRHANRRFMRLLGEVTRDAARGNSV